MSKEKIQILISEIEKLRTELNIIVSETDALTKDEVIKKSQELDKVLNEYYALLKSLDNEKEI